jgi:hypothetical protein
MNKQASNACKVMMNFAVLSAKLPKIGRESLYILQKGILQLSQVPLFSQICILCIGIGRSRKKDPMIKVYDNHLGFTVQVTCDSGKLIAMDAQRRNLIEDAHFEIFLYDNLEQMEPTANIVINDLSVGPMLSYIQAGKDFHFPAESGQKIQFLANRQIICIYNDLQQITPSAWCHCPEMIQALSQMEICAGFFAALGMLSPSFRFA